MDAKKASLADRSCCLVEDDGAGRETFKTRGEDGIWAGIAPVEPSMSVTATPHFVLSISIQLEESIVPATSGITVLLRMPVLGFSDTNLASTGVDFIDE